MWWNFVVVSIKFIVLKVSDTEAMVPFLYFMDAAKDQIDETSKL